MDLDFMESIWWVLKRLWDRGLIYEGLKSVPYSWAINTALSNFEANLNYKDVQDPAVTVRARLLGDAKSKLRIASSKDEFPVTVYAWTTTPWTLPSNMALAVGKDLTYAVVECEERKEIVVIAKDRLGDHFPALAEKKSEPKESGSKIGRAHV